MRKSVLFCLFLLLHSSVVLLAGKPQKISTRGIAEGMAVHAITQDSTGMMWLATEMGLCSFDGYELRLFDQKRIGLVNVMEISGDTLILGGTKGLFRFALTTKSFLEDIVEDPVLTNPPYLHEMIRAKSGDWIGTDKGLYYKGRKLDTLTDIFKISQLGDDLFVGTMNSLYRIRKGKEELVLDGALLVGQVVPMGDEYILGSAKKLFVLDKNSLKVKRQIDFPVVKTMLKTVLDNDSIVFIGTDEGLYTINDNKEISTYNHITSLPTMSLSGDIVWSIYTDRDGNIWIGTDNGISIIYNQPVVDWIYISEFTDSTRGNNIDCLLEDSHNRLWLGGTNGVICVESFRSDNPKSRWYRMGDPVNNILHNRIRDIFEDSDSRVWVCTDGGLFLYDSSTKKMENIIVRPNDPTWTYSIIEDKDQNLCVEMVDSLYILDPKSLTVISKERKTSTNKKKCLTRDLAGRKWYSSQNRDLIYTGGIDRVGCSTCERLLQDTITVPVRVTSVLINGKGYADDGAVNSGDITLNYDENSITVSFSDFDYDTEQLYQYYYFIDGLSKEWLPIPVGQNKITLSSLPMGKYKLYISPSKEKSHTPQLTIRITPPWYLSIPMLILYGILFVALVVAIVVYFIQRNTIRQEKQQKAQVIEQAKHKESLLQKELVVTAKNKEATSDTEAYDDSLLRKITKIIEDNMENPDLSPSTLSQILDLNQKQVYRKIKFLTGMTTVEYIRHIRLDHAASLLSSGNFTIAEVMYRVGFNNASYFSRAFLAQHNISPKDYKKNQAKASDNNISEGVN